MAFVPQVMPAYNYNADFAYPMHTNLNLMNLKNVLDQVNVDNEANFQANTNGGMNVIGKLVGSKDSVINFDVVEADIDGESVLVMIPEEEQEVPTSQVMVVDEPTSYVKVVDVPTVHKTTKPKVRPTNYIQEFESDGKVNFSGAKKSGGAANQIDSMVGGANSHFTFSLQNLDAHVGNLQMSGLLEFDGSGAGLNTVDNLQGLPDSVILFY